VGGNPSGLALGQLDGAGQVDLVVAGTASTASITASVLLSNGPGTYAPAVGYGAEPSMSAAIVDLDQDGKPDVVTSSFSGTISTLRGNGDGTFHDPVTYAASTWGLWGVAAADFSRDGWPDVCFANRDTRQVGLMLGGPGGALSAPALFDGLGDAHFLVADDFNGDGLTDIAVALRQARAVAILAGDGAGGFRSAATFPASGVSGELISLASGDFNGDGKRDLVLGNVSWNYVTVLLNTGQ